MWNQNTLLQAFLLIFLVFNLLYCTAINLAMFLELADVTHSSK